MCFCSAHRDKQRRQVAQTAHRAGKWIGNGQQQRAAVVREPCLPASELPPHERREAHECHRVWVLAQVVVQAMHPRGRSDPHPTHMLKQAAELPQGCHVCAVTHRGVLDALHGSKGLVAREKKHSRPRHEDDPKPEDRGTRLSLFGAGHGEADTARDSVPGTQERDDAIRAHCGKDDIISIHQAKSCTLTHALAEPDAAAAWRRGARQCLTPRPSQILTERHAQRQRVRRATNIQAIFRATQQLFTDRSP
eukprot:6212156-Pleurochrysis_carterae.AAC.3